MSRAGVRDQSRARGTPPLRASSRRRDQTVPLLVGLLDSASARRSADGTLQIQYHNLGDGVDDPSVDLEALAAKRISGGGMFDSVANMANSILGAGNTMHIAPRVY